MASYVQSNYNAANPTTSLGVTLSTNVSVGDLVVASYRTANSITGISDNLGNTWNALTHDISTFGSYWCIVTTGGSMTVTITQSSGRAGLSVHHYTGCESSPVDQDPAVAIATAATSSSSTAFTTTVSDGVVVASWGGSVTPTPEADYGGANLQGNGTGRLFSCHRLFTSTLTSEQATWTHSSATTQFKATAFKSTAAAVGKVQRFMLMGVS